jgi:hypothetical protein
MTGFASKRAMAQDKLNPLQKLPTEPKNDKSSASR